MSKLSFIKIGHRSQNWSKLLRLIAVVTIICNCSKLYSNNFCLSQLVTIVTTFWNCQNWLSFHNRSKLSLQGSAERPRPGCVNAAGKLRQEWQATALTKFTKPGRGLSAEPCRSKSANLWSECFTSRIARHRSQNRCLHVELVASVVVQGNGSVCLALRTFTASFITPRVRVRRPVNPVTKLESRSPFSDFRSPSLLLHLQVHVTPLSTSHFCDGNKDNKIWGKPPVSSSSGVGWNPFSHYLPSGVIRIGLSMKVKKVKIFHLYFHTGR